MFSRPRFALIGTLLVLIVLAGSGCSKQARLDRSLAQAEAFFAAGEWDKAEIAYLNTLKQDAKNAQANVQLGLLYAEQGRIGSAPRFLLTARALRPDHLEVRAKLIVLLLAAKKHEEARADARFILEHKPDHPEAPLLLAECAQTPQDVDEARAFLKKLPTASSAPVLTALAGLEFHQHQLAEAEILLKQALALEPKSAAVNASLGTLCLARKELNLAEHYFSATWENAPVRSPRKLIYVRYKLQSGDPAGAQRLLAEINTQAPDCLPPLLGLAEIAAREKKYDEALTFTNRILSRDPTHYPAIALNARLLLAKNEPDKALLELKKLEKAQPKNPEVHYQSGLCHLAQGNLDQAVSSLNQAIALAPGYTEAILILADLNLRRGEAKSASATLKALVAQNPGNLPAKFLLAKAYASQNLLDEALVTFKEITAASPQEPNYLFPLALIYRQQKNYAEARRVLEKILELVPQSGPAIEQLVDLDLLSGQLPAARQRAEALLALQPTQAAAHLLLAKINLADQNPGLAETALLQAIALQPEIPSAYYLLAGIYLQSGQEKKALDQLQQLVLKTPKDPSLHMRIAVIHERLKDYPAARDAYEKILALQPKFIPALNNLAYLYAAQFNQAERALPLAQKARALAPLDPSIADTLGWILYLQGQYKPARTLLLESAGKSPDNADVQFHLGMAHYMMGEIEAARAALLRAQQLNPDLPEKNLLDRRLAILGADRAMNPSAQRAILEKALADQPNDPVALTELGIMLEQTGEYAPAEKNLKSALAINPSIVQASLSLIRVYLARHEIAPALELAKATRQQSPENPAITHQLGLIAFQTGDFPWAASLLQESARQQPDDLDVLLAHAKAAYSIGRVAEAEAALQRIKQANPLHPSGPEITRYLDMIALTQSPSGAESPKILQLLKTEPHFVPALMALGANAEKAADFPAARQAYEKALAQYPDFLPAKKQIAQLAGAANTSEPKDYDLAVQAREAYPNDPEIAQALGILAYRRGDFNRSASLLKESLARQANDARGTFYLGMAQYRLKEKPARATLQKALELGLSDEAASEAKRALAELP